MLIRNIMLKILVLQEISKYVTKGSEIFTDDHDLTDRAVYTLDKALHGKRLIEFAGLFKKIRRDLNFDDPEIADDLVNVDGNTDLNEELSFELISYRWNIGYRQYIKIEEKEKK